jgi:hypothetical protein
MAYAPTDFASREIAFTKNSVRSNAPTRRGVWRRFLDAIIASRQRHADYEIARFLGTHGGRLTDEIEREIERRFLHRSPGKF